MTLKPYLQPKPTLTTVKRLNLIKNKLSKMLKLGYLALKLNFLKLLQPLLTLKLTNPTKMRQSLLLKLTLTMPKKSLLTQMLQLTLLLSAKSICHSLKSTLLLASRKHFLKNSKRKVLRSCKRQVQ